MKILKKSFLLIVIALIMALLVACGQDAEQESSKEGEKEGSDSIKIGLSVVDLSLERWQHDRDIFIETAEGLGAEVIVQSADGDADKQLSQIENMLSQNVDVVVIIAANSDALSPVVQQAKEQGVIVVAHDRLINDSDVDAYVSFDNETVGEMQAEYLIERISKGKYFLLGGEPSDHSAQMFRKGQMNVLDPLIEAGDIEVVGDQWADGYGAEQALSIIENALTANDNDIDAIVAPNDSTAGGAVQALEAQELAGEVLVTGQDADLAAVQRIAEGTQSMTVYKSIKEIATTSAEVAVALAKEEEIEPTTTINNGYKDVPFFQLTPISVDKDNLLEEIVGDDFHSYDDIYKNIPEDERPDRP